VKAVTNKTWPQKITGTKMFYKTGIFGKKLQQKNSLAMLIVQWLTNFNKCRGRIRSN
jgi:hypothetical protein